MSEMPTFDHSLLGPLVDRVSDGVAVAVPGPWRVVYANQALSEWLGKTAGELRGSPLEHLFRPDLRAEVNALADHVCQGSAPSSDITLSLQPSEETGGRSANVRFCRIVVKDQAFLGVVVHCESPWSSEVQVGPERLDPLTNLPDRQFLMLRLAALLRGQRSADPRFAVLFVDLDNFKQVNDAHGHLVGDRVLREVAHRLTSCVRDIDYVVRFGGDEFVVLVESVTGPSVIEPIVERIHTALERPIALPHGEFRLSLSIGVAVASPDHHSPEDLLRDADRAMYAAKRLGDKTSPFPAVN